MGYIDLKESDTLYKQLSNQRIIVSLEYGPVIISSGWHNNLAGN